jgi:hypothetical protein
VNTDDTLRWFDELEKRATQIRASQTGEHDVWSSLFAEMHTAVAAVFPPSHVIPTRWQDAVDRASSINRGNRVELPELRVASELIGTFQAAHRLLKDGRLGRLAEAVRAETVGECITQAATLASSGYPVAAIVLAGGGLEMHLKGLCVRFALMWPGEGSIAKYNQALAQARNSGTQNIVTSSDTNLIEAWAKNRNEAAHSPATFSRQPVEVQLAIEGIRQFLSRTE